MNGATTIRQWSGGLRKLAAGLACAAFLLGTSAADAQKNNGRTGTAAEYVTLKPIIVPVLTGDAVRSEFAVVVMLELTDIDKRIDLVMLKPRLRDRLFRELLQMVTFRARSARMPRNSDLKRRLLAAAQEVVGPGLVKSLLLGQAYHRALR